MESNGSLPYFVAKISKSLFIDSARSYTSITVICFEGLDAIEQFGLAIDLIAIYISKMKM